MFSSSGASRAQPTTFSNPALRVRQDDYGSKPHMTSANDSLPVQSGINRRSSPKRSHPFKATTDPIVWQERRRPLERFLELHGTDVLCGQEFCVRWSRLQQTNLLKRS